jgi:hypothetical protein
MPRNRNYQNPLRRVSFYTQLTPKSLEKASKNYLPSAYSHKYYVGIQPSILLKGKSQA